MSGTYPASELTFLRAWYIFYKECKKYNRFLNQIKQKKELWVPQYCKVKMEHGSDVKVQWGVEPFPNIIVLHAEQIPPNGKKPSLYITTLINYQT